MTWSRIGSRKVALVAPFVLGVSLLLTAASARADAPLPEGVRAKIEHRIRTMRAMVLTEALDLDAPTAKKLFALMDRHDDKRRTLARARGEVMVKVKHIAKTGEADHKTVDVLFKKLLENRMAEHRLSLTMAGETKAFLSPRQRARLAMVLPRFYRRVQKLINEAKREILRKALDEGF